MLKKLSKLVLLLGLMLSFNATYQFVGAADMAVFAETCAGSEGDVLNPGDCNTGDVKTINDRIYSFAATIAGLVLGVAVVMIVYAGFKYATSQGDPKVTEQAKMQIISAGIGIFIAMLAFVILKIFSSIMG